MSYGTGALQVTSTGINLQTSTPYTTTFADTLRSPGPGYHRWWQNLTLATAGLASALVSKDGTFTFPSATFTLDKLRPDRTRRPHRRGEVETRYGQIAATGSASSRGGHRHSRRRLRPGRRHLIHRGEGGRRAFGTFTTVISPPGQTYKATYTHTTPSLFRRRGISSVVTLQAGHRRARHLRLVGEGRSAEEDSGDRIDPSHPRFCARPWRLLALRCRDA
jgi:hypothetical protein